MASANERRRYNVTSPLIGWAHTQYQPSLALLDVSLSTPFLKQATFSVETYLQLHDRILGGNQRFPLTYILPPDWLDLTTDYIGNLRVCSG